MSVPLRPLFLSPSPDDTVTARQWAGEGTKGTTRLEWLEPDDPSRCAAGGVQPVGFPLRGSERAPDGRLFAKLVEPLPI